MVSYQSQLSHQSRPIDLERERDQEEQPGVAGEFKTDTERSTDQQRVPRLFISIPFLSVASCD